MKLTLSNRNIAAFYLVAMCTNIVILDGWGVSTFKVALMALAPVIILFRAPYFTKAMAWSALYFAMVVFLAVIVHEGSRISTLMYLLLFLMMFCMYYNLLYEGAFTIDFFIKLIKWLIYAYLICFIGQQLLYLAGIRYFPFFNMLGQEYYGLFRLNSLMREPSGSARIVTVAFYAFLKCSEIKNGRALSLKELFVDNRWLTLGFLYIMIGMGSGTAFVGLAVLSLYFIRREYVMIIVPAAFLLYLAVPLINYEPLERARVTMEATFTGDNEEVKQADRSASARILPLLNTLNVDLFSKETWIGHGIDAAVKTSYVADDRMIVGVHDYGLLSYIVMQFLVFTCCIRRVFSIETLIYIGLLGAGFSNVSYVWGVLMVFAAIRYFYYQIAEAENTEKVELACGDSCRPESMPQQS